jgi:hypothetical protein
MAFDPDIPPGAELTSKELTSIFQGQEQGGMRYSKATNSLVLVTHPKKLSVAAIYGDEWIGGALHYRGTGQRGDQSLTFAGNSRLMNAATADTGVHLVERRASGRYRYLGRVALAGNPYRRNEADADGNMRLVWVFPLQLLSAAPDVAAAAPTGMGIEEVPRPLELLPSDEVISVEVVSVREPGLDHESIQLRLLEMGAGLGLDVWVATNDRGKKVDGKAFVSMPRMRDALPTQFDPRVMRIIQNIDVLWLRGNGIEAAFEIEHTTSIYSGLLRMSDLVTLHPNFQIRLYIVAPDIRESKVLHEITRPTFDGLPRPLREFCGCITYSRLLVEAEMVKKYGSQLKPGFLQDIARFAVPLESSASGA